MRIIGTSARVVDRHSITWISYAPLTERGRGRRSRFSVPRPRVSSAQALVLLAVSSVLLGLAGCGQARDEHSSVSPARVDPAKAGFIVAADQVCARHLDTILAWLEKPQTGSLWQQSAAQNEGIYRIMAATITRLQGLGSPPGPTADAFAGYLKTLKARAVLYRLTSMADQRRDRSFAARLQQRVDQIDTIGDRDASRYGLRICGSGAREIAPPVEPDGSIRD
jgi:hypothetical protein